jgi:hypothetical protein
LRGGGRCGVLLSWLNKEIKRRADVGDDGVEDGFQQQCGGAVAGQQGASAWVGEI